MNFHSYAIQLDLCAFFCARKDAVFTTNKEFSKLTDAERVRKLDMALRSQTGNALTAGQIKAAAESIYLGRQYVISVHPSKTDACKISADERRNVLNIYVPEKLFISDEKKEGLYEHQQQKKEKKHSGRVP